MPVNCSTGFRARIIGPSTFESIFNGGCIEVYTGAPPAHADMPPGATLLGRVTGAGVPWTNGSPVNGLQFARDGHRAVNNAAQEWILKGLATGTAGWARLRPTTDTGALSQSIPRIDMAVGPLDTPGDYQIRLPSLAITAAVATPITSWWFVLPPLD